LKKIIFLEKIQTWFTSNNWIWYDFQKTAAKNYYDGKNGLVNAPTGSGKTYALALPFLVKHGFEKPKSGIRVLWITPLRALSTDIHQAIETATLDLKISWRVALRHGDVPSAKKQAQMKSPPQVLVTTPESVHIMLANKNREKLFKNLDCVVVDEWHELIGNKRGVLIELAIAAFKMYQPKVSIWGISATIGNLEQAKKVLAGENAILVKSKIKKKMDVNTLLPPKIEKLPWAGHLGLTMSKQIDPIIKNAKTSLIFTNTRGQAEIWYQKILDANPHFAGLLAMHHGSLSKEVRQWVEEALHIGSLKAVICTSSLDLGVDFRPVDTVIQVGSPKGISRFAQRGGRSGHGPNLPSKLYFLPTNALELIEASALKKAIEREMFEAREPMQLCFDILIQFLVTLAVGGGFDPNEIFLRIKKTSCFSLLTESEFSWCLHFIQFGGKGLQAYEEFRKVEDENGKFIVKNKRIAMRHRLSIGAIVSETNLKVKLQNGKVLGHIEEYFISKLNIGSAFTFAGAVYDLLEVKGMEVRVKKSKKRSAVVPSWMGGRMSLTSEISDLLREELSLSEAKFGPEMRKLNPLLKLQKKRSLVPLPTEFLIETFESQEGHHIFMYPFEGRKIHEGLSMILAHRISKIAPMSVSLAMNDYGFEIVSAKEIPIFQALEEDLFSTKNLLRDIQDSTNQTIMAKRKFRDIASIAGLTFKGYPNKLHGDKHLQANAQLFFDVFNDYDPENLLLRQAFDEVLFEQLDEQRIFLALSRISTQEIVVKKLSKPSPFSFPIMVDRLNRNSLSNEKMEDRIKRLLETLEK
tara:strand:- start:20113 stop:22530 length:2418 start_codon:yes stop_codon:yes gene_type:complete